ncbi:unnamed protein product, partial [Prorocentrum cordatum]
AKMDNAGAALAAFFNEVTCPEFKIDNLPTMMDWLTKAEDPQSTLLRMPEDARAKMLSDYEIQMNEFASQLWTLLLNLCHSWLGKTVLKEGFKAAKLEGSYFETVNVSGYGKKCSGRMANMSRARFASVEHEAMDNLKDLFSRLPQYSVLKLEGLTLEKCIEWRIIQEVEMNVPCASERTVKHSG